MSESKLPETLSEILPNSSLVIKIYTVPQKEKEILRALYILGYSYIARDRDGSLCTYKTKPYKDKIGWAWEYDDVHFIHLGEFPNISYQIDFQFIKWEDEKPFDIKAFLECEGYEN